jgi:hypothetical protein
LVHLEKRKNKKTGKIEMVEVLSFPPKYIKEKKLYIWEKVAKLEPQIEWVYGKNGNLKNMNYDMVDSYVVSIAGLITLGVITKEDWKKRYTAI